MSTLKGKTTTKPSVPKSSEDEPETSGLNMLIMMMKMFMRNFFLVDWLWLMNCNFFVNFNWFMDFLMDLDWLMNFLVDLFDNWFYFLLNDCFLVMDMHWFN
ncbi:hypothetical protein PVAND_004547 [Polypedilum vanderplanki]|uniref:Uncharacterized protein n=1 Tax=Polypedilum vanderplanki TaxID=319348 RepID=A0A9J6BXA7_POLVA|nr:hypothetical protein PVAND_004547 [Polypedilum vanderplanki]